jgi:hypothetical protein
MHKTYAARVFEDVGGYYWCDEHGPLDTRGRAHPTKVSACRAAIEHAITQGFSTVILRGSGVTRRAREFGNGHIRVRVEGSQAQS